jgi:hypothetical protein
LLEYVLRRSPRATPVNLIARLYCVSVARLSLAVAYIELKEKREGGLAEQAMSKTSEDRVNWRVGQRVSRKDSRQLGTVIEKDGTIKVKWDDGRTSYYRHKTPGNVKKAPAR